MKPTPRKPVVVARSRLGKGVFAARPFAAGRPVLTFTGETLSLSQAERRGVGEHCLQVAADRTLYVDEPARYVNHSCDPNAGLRDAVTLFALRPIAAGEEITFDYSTCVLEEGWSLACSCGSLLCRGSVVEFSKLDAVVKRRYVKLKAAPAWLFARAKTPRRSLPPAPHVCYDAGVRVLIAPNAFKGSLTALAAARAMRRGVLSVFPDAKTVLLPISDGGDGLMEVLLSAKGGMRVWTRVMGPFGEERRAAFGLMRGRTAVVEMARASGLALNGERRDPLNATSFGTGQLIKAAMRRGARTILVGLGGSATNDGGAGMAQALGARLLDRSGRELGRGAQALLRLEHIEWERPGGARVIAISDVDNPLIGARGSARVYGPQKGATPRMVGLLEECLGHYAKIIKRDLGIDVAKIPGAAAAGGLGAGLIAFLGAEITPGAAFVLETLGAKRFLKAADLVLTGEGRLDRTSFYGKAPVELARLAKKAGVPAAGIFGVIDAESRPILKEAVSFAEAGAGAADSFSRAAHWAAKAAALLFLSLTARAQDSGLAEIDRLYFHRNEGNNLEDSIARTESLLAGRPDDPGLLLRLGRGWVRLGERQAPKRERLGYFQKAETEFRRSIALKADDADAHFWLGVALGRRGQAQGILRSLFLVKPIRKEMAEALKLDPKHGGAHHVLGEIFRQLPGFAGGDKKAAARELEEAIRLDPDHTSHYPALAKAYLSLGEKEKAKEALKKALEVRVPSDPAEAGNDLDEAREMLRSLGS